MRKGILIVMCAVAGLYLSGCATAVKKTAVEAPGKTAETETTEKYVVKKGESLWAISDKKYSNPFQWPLLFRANRDQIQDPDIIEPGQQFDLRRDASEAEIMAAVQNAKDTPPYKKHSSPRKKLPLKY